MFKKLAAFATVALVAAATLGTTGAEASGYKGHGYGYGHGYKHFVTFKHGHYGHGYGYAYGYKHYKPVFWWNHYGFKHKWH